MIGTHLMPHRIRPVASVEHVDDYGNRRRVPGEPGDELPAYVQPSRVTEDGTDGQTRETRHKVFLGPEPHGLDAWSHLEWEGRRYELVGDPRRHDSPAGRHHVTVTIRRVGPE